MDKTVELAKSVRKTYSFNPATRFHSTRKGKKGFSKQGRRQGKSELRGI